MKLSFGFAVKRYVRKGVPCEHRTQIWMAASGAQDQLERNPGYYHSLLTAEHDPKIEETIHAGKLLLLKLYFILHLYSILNRDRTGHIGNKILLRFNIFPRYAQNLP